MRRSFKMLSVLLVLVMMVSVFTTGCTKKSSGKLKVGVSLPTLQEERWQRDKDTMEKAAKEAGVELIVKVSNANMGEQITQVEALLNQGIKVLILAPHDASAAGALVDKAKKEGVKVISYDRLITGTENLEYYLSFDNVGVGKLQGEYITKLVPEGNYIIMSGAPTDNNAKLFKEGAMEYIQPLIDSGKIKVVAEQGVDDWKPENAMKIVEAGLLSSNNDVQAILAPNDGTAGGAISALAAQGLDGKVPVTGQDSELAAAQRIVQGKQTMTIFKDTRDLGKKAIEMAKALAAGETVTTNGTVDNGKVMVPSVLLTPYAVDKDNIDKLLIDSGYLKKDDVYKK